MLCITSYSTAAFCRALRVEILRAITPATVRAWWVNLGKETPTSNTHAYQLLKAIYNTAIADKAVTTNPCQIKSAGEAP